MKCNAKTRNRGRCQKPPSRNGRCRLHGGASLAGTASPRFKHGKYSKYMPELLIERRGEFSEAELLNCHRESLALLRARKIFLLEQLSKEEATPDFLKLKNNFVQLEKVINTGNLQIIKRRFAKCKELLSAAKAQADAWREIFKVTEQCRKLVESEAKQYKIFNQVLTVEQSLVFASRVAAIVKKHVTDRETLDGVVKEFSEIINFENKL